MNSITRDNALKTIVKGFGFTFFATFFSKILLYLLRIFLTRTLTPQDYGLLFLGFSLIYMTVFFVLLGLESGIERYISYYRARKNFRRVRGIILSSLSISIPLSLLMCAIFWFFSHEISVLFFHEPNLSPVLKILSFVIPIFVVYKIFYSSLLSFKKIGYAAFSWYICRPLSTLVFLTILVFGFGLEGAAFSYVMGFAISALLTFFFMEWKVFHVIRTDIKPIFMRKKLLAFSLPLVVFSILWNIMTRVDTIMIGSIKTSLDVGLYQTAAPTSQFLFIIPSALGALFIPVLSELLSKNKRDDIKKVYRTVSKWIFYLNFPLFLVFVTYPNAVINILFGSDYIGAGNSLRILAIGYLVFSIGGVATGIINLFEKTKYHIFNASLSLVIGIVLNYLLIPVFGIDGAAVATMITFIFYTVLLVFEARMISGCSPFDSAMLKSLVSGLLSTLVMYSLTKMLFANLNVWILIPVFVIFTMLYSIFLLIFKGLGEEDIMILKAIERKTGLEIKPLRKIIKKFI